MEKIEVKITDLSFGDYVELTKYWGDTLLSDKLREISYDEYMGLPVGAVVIIGSDSKVIIGKVGEPQSIDGVEGALGKVYWIGSHEGGVSNIWPKYEWTGIYVPDKKLEG